MCVCLWVYLITYLFIYGEWFLLGGGDYKWTLRIPTCPASCRGPTVGIGLRHELLHSASENDLLYKSKQQEKGYGRKNLYNRPARLWHFDFQLELSATSRKSWKSFACVDEVWFALRLKSKFKAYGK